MRTINGFATGCVTIVMLLFCMGVYAQAPEPPTQKIYAYDSDSLASKPRLEDENVSFEMWFGEVSGCGSRFYELMRPLIKGIEGIEKGVDFSFIVNTKGRIEDICILESSGEEYTRIVMEEIKKCPRWIPGIDLQGNTVPVRILESIGYGIDVDEFIDQSLY